MKKIDEVNINPRNEDIRTAMLLLICNKLNITQDEIVRVAKLSNEEWKFRLKNHN